MTRDLSALPPPVLCRLVVYEFVISVQVHTAIDDDVLFYARLPVLRSIETYGLTIIHLEEAAADRSSCQRVDFNEVFSK